MSTIEPKTAGDTLGAFQDLGGGTSRRLLVYNEDMMMVEVAFEKGAVGSVHTHPHTQCTCVLEGAFLFTVDGVEHEVHTGDTLLFASNQPHGTVCLEKGRLLDVFTPARKDFL